MKTFSDRLRFLRGRDSQAAFAKRLGISSQQSYANYESGRIPKGPVLSQIAKACNVSLEWLINGTGTPKPALDPISDAIQETAAAFGSPFGGKRSPVESLPSNVLFELLEGMPAAIAENTNPAVKDRLVYEAETAAQELRRRHSTP